MNPPVIRILASQMAWNQYGIGPQGNWIFEVGLMEYSPYLSMKRNLINIQLELSRWVRM